MAWHAESSPYDTVEGLRSGCNPPAQAAANRRLPMTGHGSTTETRSNAQLLPSTTRHVIPHRDKEAWSHRHTKRRGIEKHTYNFTKMWQGNFRLPPQIWLQLNTLAFDKFTLLTVVIKDSRHWSTSSLHECITCNYFRSFVCAQQREQAEKALAWSTGAAEVESKCEDTDIFCRCLLIFYESSGRTLTNQSWLLVEERHHTHRK